jgi:hypothetical protein
VTDALNHVFCLPAACSGHPGPVAQERIFPVATVSALPVKNFTDFFFFLENKNWTALLFQRRQLLFHLAVHLFSQADALALGYGLGDLHVKHIPIHSVEVFSSKRSLSGTVLRMALNRD